MKIVIDTEKKEIEVLDKTPLQEIYNFFDDNNMFDYSIVSKKEYISVPIRQPYVITEYKPY